MSLRIESDQLLEAPIEAVFDLLADPRERPLWQRTCRWVEVEGDAGEAPRLGTRWRERALGAGVHELEICAFERPSHWAERMLSGRVIGELHVHLAAEGGRTRVRAAAELEPQGIVRLGTPILRRAMLHEMPRDIARLGRVAAGRQAAG